MIPMEIYVPEILSCGSITDHDELEIEDKKIIRDELPSNQLFDNCTLVSVPSMCSTVISTGNASFDEEQDAFHISHDIYMAIPNPKCKKPRRETPATIMICDTIGALKSRRVLKVLFDTGSRKSFINESVLPPGCIPTATQDSVTMRTMMGTFTASEVVKLRDIRLPEFDTTRHITQQTAFITKGACRYDLILGTDFLSKAGIRFDYDDGMMRWFDAVLPMRDPFGLTSQEFDDMEDALFVQYEDELLGEDWLDSFATEILDAKYDYTTARDVINRQDHLDAKQKEDLLKVLEKHQKLFDGTLGVYPHRKVHIELEKGATPKWSRPYPVPRIHLETFRKELFHMVELGILVRAEASEWASPSFIVPKKDGRVRWISDLRALNKVIKRRQYPLPIINDILRKRTGYAFFTKLDISMQYYTFELDEESSKLCTINTPFGLFKYNRLPMGLKCSPDFAQEVMEGIFSDIDDTDVYIDDVGNFSQDWDSHMELLDTVLRRLKDNGFTVNPLKCEWAVQETDWLGYWLTPRGLKPWKKKIDAILHMDRPQTPTALRSFIGMVNYYRDMWPSRAHVLKPLSDKAGLKKKEKLIWTDEMQIAFDKMKKLLAADALIAYPDHNKRFDIYTDASDYQLGACIMQEGRPVAYFSRKLSGSQLNYTTMEKELLAIIATLKEFRSMLLGSDIHIFTDHKNLTFDTLTTQRVLRWRNYCEEYAPILHYIEGERNILADNLSRLHRLPTPTQIAEGKRLVEPAVVSDAEDDEFDSFFVDLDRSGFCDADLKEILDTYLNLPESDVPEENPLNYEHIAEMQKSDENLARLKAKWPQQYVYKRLDESIEPILCYVRPNDNQDTQWRIALPEAMLLPSIKWFHQVLGHPGQKRLRETLSQRYYHPQMRSVIDNYHCEYCQRHKLSGKGYGLLPEREMRIAPWEEVAVDLIGPWNIKVNGKVVEFNALTIIDTATNLVELVRIDNKSSEHIRDKFMQTWLARYPKPARCVHDKGGEFVGWEFQTLLRTMSIKDASSTSKNPQSNSICERMHQTVGNVLRTLLYGNPPKTMTKAREILDSALSTAMHAMRTTIATTLKSTPGSLAFSRDMFLNIPLIADWQTIAQHREHHVNENLRRMNAKRRRFDYAPGQEVLKKVHDPTKLGERTTGPYKILRVHANGTVTMLLKPGVTERINIRRLLPFRK